MLSATKSLLTRAPAVAPPAGPSFVTRDLSTGRLMLDGAPFRFSGSNVFNDVGLVDAGNGNSYGGTNVGGFYLPTHSQIDALLTSAVAQNASVLRPFGALMSRGTPISLQPTLGTFNPTALENVDYFLQQCAIKGLKVIFPLTDEYDFSVISGRVWYTAVTGGGADSNFYTRTATINAFKAQIAYVLDHVNVYTGIAYKDDPTILCWETGNELTYAGATQAQFAAWTDTISQYIKLTKGAQQLVMDGGLGVTYDGGTYETLRLALPYVDIYSNHMYDIYRTPAWVAAEAASAHAYAKAFVIGEFSWTDKQVNGSALNWTLGQLLATAQNSEAIDGDLYFDLLAPSSIWGGGFTLHEPPDLTFQGVSLAEAQWRGDMLTDHALQMRGIEPRTFLSDSMSTIPVTISPNMVVALGDSITDYASAYDYQPWLGNNWFNQLLVRSKERMKYGGVYATGSMNLTQIRDTHVPQVLSLNPRPAFCIIAGGANDAQNVGGTYSRSYSAGVLQNIVDSLVAVGIKPILWKITPHPNTAANVTDWNAYIGSYAAANGYPVLDAFSAVTDGGTGWLAGTTPDDLHPNNYGMQLIAAKAIADGLPNIFPVNDPHLLTARTTSDLTNLLNDGTTNLGLFTVDTNGDGMANGFTQTSGTVTRVDPSGGDDLVGKWQQLRHVTTGQQISFARTISSGWAAGDVLAFSARVQTENMLSNARQWHLAINATVPGGFTTPSGATLTTVSVGIIGWYNDVDGLMYVEFTVPAGTTSLQVLAFMDSVTAGQDPKLRVGELTVRNLGTPATAPVLSSHIGEIGAIWDQQGTWAGIATVQNNRLWATNQSLYYASGVPASADYSVTASIYTASVLSGAYAGVLLHAHTEYNGSYAAYIYHNGSNVALYLQLYYAGGQTDLGSVVLPTPVAGDSHTLMLKIRGTALEAWWDGGLRLVNTSSVYPAPGRAGVIIGGGSASSGWHIDSIIGVDWMPTPSLSPPVKRPNYGALLQV